MIRTKTKRKPANLDNFTLYLNIIKIIYEKGEKGATREDITRYLKVKLNYNISKQSISKIIENIKVSNYLSQYIKIYEEKRPFKYIINSDYLNDDFLRFFTDKKYNYDEFLAFNTLKTLNSNNIAELTKDLKNNFMCLDNPLIDTKMSELELKYTKKIFKLMNKKLKATITMKSNEVYKVIFLKIIYSDKNWYALVKQENESIELKRLAFIEDITEIIGSNYKDIEIPDKLDIKLKKLNNALSNYNNLDNVNTATLEISDNIKQYFQKDMKKFFKYQIIIQENPLIIDIQYTSELEILRFVKSWLPDIKILKPKTLQESFKQSLKQALNTYQ
ncbi:WYL domain-containing protein [Campylobacter sp. MG1]|uniref:WYL domain-containing protein n=1 Tax=Campylobacter sp. MG1 TaxID=2976332 RepID=UPI00226CAFA9|nr:WYL domain-containing protein [Campylobacter sp. MG1]